jgi:hypothetical protein
MIVAIPEIHYYPEEFTQNYSATTFAEVSFCAIREFPKNSRFQGVGNYSSAQK